MGRREPREEWTMDSAGMVNMGEDKCQNDRRIAATITIWW